MKHVISKDGTAIAYEQTGTGPAVILVTGALGGLSIDLAAQLSPHFTVFDYYRRGRGESGDTLPYAPDREIEDIEALIDKAGGSAFLYGLSSGAILAIKAAKQLGNKVMKQALYEPPFIIDASHPPLPADYVEQLNAAIAAGCPGDAVNIFMTKALGIPQEFVDQMRNAPMSDTFKEGAKPPEWAEMEKVAHTLAYDGLIVRDMMQGKPWPANQWSGVKAKTLVITGEQTEPFFLVGAKALVKAVDNAQYRIMAGQSHAVSADMLAPVLIEFFES